MGTSVPWARVYRLSSLALMHIKWSEYFIYPRILKYDMPVDLDEIVNRPPPEADAVVKFALRIVI